MTAFIFTLALIAVCGFAAWRGGRDERIAAGAIALAALLSPFVALHRYAGPEVGLILVDLGLFIVLAGISLQSRAFWPMWAAGFQLCGLAGHLAAAKSTLVLPAAYAETLAVWAYAVIATLLVGTLMEGQHRHGRG
jgi:hypothetical protein